MPNLFNRVFRKFKAGAPIIVVSGLPRSGTSLLMSMLEAGGVELVKDGIRTADVDNPKGYYEFERVKELDKPGDRAWLGAAKGKGIKIISFLLRYLPDTYQYKIIFVHRNLQEVLASQAKMLARRGELPGDASDEEMSRLFEAHLKKVEAMIGRRPNCDVIHVHYRETVESPALVAARISEFLGGRLNVEQMSQVADKDLYRNRG